MSAESRAHSAQAGASTSEISKKPSKSSRRAEKLQKWESVKGEVHRLYIFENKTLEETISAIGERFPFTPSVRKWKMKLKEWGFDKNLSRSEMTVLVAKATKRFREDGKDTVFFVGETEISCQKLENFKRRKISGGADIQFASADTPPNVTYSTPEPEDSKPLCSHEDEQQTPASLGLSSDGSSPSNTEGASKSETVIQPPELIRTLIHSLEATYRILTHDANPRLHQVLSQVDGYYSEVSDLSLASFSERLAFLARKRAIRGDISGALVTHFVAIVVCLGCGENQQSLEDYLKKFLTLQEQEIFLPASLRFVFPSYQQLLKALTIHGMSEPICTRMARTLDRLHGHSTKMDYLRIHLWYVNDVHASVFSELSELFELLQRLFLDLPPWQNPDCDDWDSETSRFETGNNKSLGAEELLLTIIRGVFLVQSNALALRTYNQRSLHAQLLQRILELPIDGIGGLFGSVLAVVVSKLDNVLFTEYIVRTAFPWHRQRTVEGPSAIQTIMHLDGSALKRSLVEFFGRIEDKVQGWLESDVVTLGTQENDTASMTMEPIRSEWNEFDGASSIFLTSFDTEKNQHDLVGEDMGCLQANGSESEGIFSVMEVDDSELEDCHSMVTDPISSKLGITYTESNMTGISFNYSALYP